MMPGRAWATAVLLVAAGVNPVAAQPLAPDGPAPASAGFEPLPPAATSTRTSSVPRHPPAILGAPIAISGTTARPSPEPAPSDGAAIPASFSEDPAPKRQGRGVGLGAPSVAGQASELFPASGPIPSRAAEASVRQAGAIGPVADPVNDLLGQRSGKGERDKRDPAGPTARGPSRKFGDRLHGILGDQGEWFKSDHAFDGFISPVTNPFLFEDPRSLTEIRPIFLYQKIPGRQPDFNGGNVSVFGVQGRVAVTERLSFTLNKFGGIWLDPKSGSPVDGSSGFAELWFGPKYTFIRNPDTGSLVAGGLQFQAPVGSKGAFQNTGGLSLVPYATYGQNLFRDFSWGSFNTLANGGYAFGTSKARSDYLFLSGHIDWDVMNWHRFYPLFEMNYLLYTANGNAFPIGSEGRDLFNFGGQAKGNGLLTGAFGARFKITENAQVGAAYEIPFAGPKDLFQYRFTIDFILRF